ncbi:MAG: hypothetical protein RL215_1242, partial [Planctomycetota bacterium]
MDFDLRTYNFVAATRDWLLLAAGLA